MNYTISSLFHFCSPVLADIQLCQIGRLFNHQTLLIGEMQQTDEAKRGGNVVHDWLGVYRLQIVHDRRKLERLVVLWW